MPLSMHSKAQAAHEAAEAANQQGKFWEMHDLIFKNQREMSPENYLLYAAELELDVEKFKRDLKSKAVKTRIDDDLKAAGTLGVTGTPSFFVNGQFLSGAKPFSSFKKLIDSEIAKK